MKESVSLLGNGFVGSSMKETFKDYFDLYVYDILPEKRNVNSLEELSKKSEVIFLSLPTPIKKDGSISLKIIESCLEELNKLNNNNLVVNRSSTPPGTTDMFQEKYKNLRFVFNPEFLTERNAVFDFKHQKKVILAGNKENVDKIEKIYKVVFPDVPIYKSSFKEAEFCKLVINTFLAVKVSLMNEYFDFCEASNIDFNKSMKLILTDERIGESHTKVPSHIDGKRGFSGSCFPANINILIAEMKKANVDPKILNAAWEKNLEVRPEKDWEQLKNRVVAEGDDE